MTICLNINITIKTIAHGNTFCKLNALQIFPKGGASVDTSDVRMLLPAPHSRE